MADPGFRFVFQKTMLTVEMTDNAGHTARASLPLIDVERLITQLASFRKDMTPEVRRALPDGPATGEVDPIWAIPTHPQARDKLLSVSDSALGWLRLVLPEGECRNLAQALRPG